ncbi:MAG: UpxY family transcription antiterminator [Prevotellaceae bacterium]|jgi:transcription antitermination factor NusG|nr:UpxY family transcription antiterminator [Prevotellaceae bacterium]
MKQRFVFWYVAKVKYRTEKKIKQYLEKEGIEHYIPLQEEKPLLPCTIFIRTDYERALSLPVECGCTIDYLYNTDTTKLRVVPDKQIEDFMFLQDFSERTILLTHPEDLKGGERVRVIKGEFTGIEGELYRIQGHKRVVVRLEGLVSVAMGSYIAKECLERI